MRFAVFFAAATLSLIACAGGAGAQSDLFPTRPSLGKALFHDKALSANRTQACATCHMPQAGFVDRNDVKGSPVSRGDDGKSFGDRNAPSAGYAALTPAFYRDAQGNYVGGQFWDGRASALEDQAAGPPLNPMEMGMADDRAVAARIAENPAYVAAFTALFGADVLEDPQKTFRATTEAIAAFERTPDFAPFDSRYDRYLRGQETLTEQEELGRTLFFSSQFANCSLCHDLKGRDGRLETSVFSSHQYFNIGVPVNVTARKINGVQPDYVDIGLAANPVVDGDPKQRGKFKVPSLRNVAVTGPYMHNGVFSDLRTVILFYNKYNSKKKSRQINPETGQRWAEPEIADTIDREKLETGPGLDDKRVDALVAFLKTLTDKRYEPLLTQK